MAETWAKYESAGQVHRWDTALEVETKDIGDILANGAADARQQATNDNAAYQLLKAGQIEVAK